MEFTGQCGWRTNFVFGQGKTCTLPLGFAQCSALNVFCLLWREVVGHTFQAVPHPSLGSLRLSILFLLDSVNQFKLSSLPLQHMCHYAMVTVVVKTIHNFVSVHFWKQAANLLLSLLALKSKEQSDRPSHCECWMPLTSVSSSATSKLELILHCMHQGAHQKKVSSFWNRLGFFECVQPFLVVFLVVQSKMTCDKDVLKCSLILFALGLCLGQRFRQWLGFIFVSD